MGPPASSTEQHEELCWILASAMQPHPIIEVSLEWSAAWLVDRNDAIGSDLGSVLDGEGCDRAVTEALVAQFLQRRSATQRCRKTRSDGLAIEHTVSLAHAVGGILVVSTDFNPKPMTRLAQSNSMPASLTAIGAQIAAEQLVLRERAGSGSPSACDLLAARIDLLEDMLEDYADRLQASSLASKVMPWSNESESEEESDTLTNMDEPTRSATADAKKRPQQGSKSCTLPSRPLCVRAACARARVHVHVHVHVACACACTPSRLPHSFLTC